jgi:hypothetical protein
LLLHAKERWGKAISVYLWPYAVGHRNDVYNATRKVSKRASPIEIFSNMTIRSQLKHFHAFGCPAYRLNRDLQGGHSQPRWEQRAEPVVYLGGSPKHASLITLVLDLTTAHVSPQFHLKFDDLFETVSATRQNSQAQKSLWQQLCHFGSEKRTRTKSTALRPIDQAQEGQVIHPSQSEDLPARVIPLDGPGQFFPAGQHEIDDGEAENGTSEGECSLIPEPPEAVVESVGRRSGRIRQPTQQFVESQEQLSQGIVSYFTSHESIDPQMYKEDLLLKEFETDPISFKATADPDTMYLHKAMRAPDAAQFKEAHWVVVRKTEVPSHAKILPAVWSMKRKRRIETREVYKHKARLNLGGHKQ